MKVIKKIVKWILYLLSIPLIYCLISLLLSSITINRKAPEAKVEKSIYLNTNGVHLDIILAKTDLDSMLLSGIHSESTENYLSFGWGDENFYLNTPTWGDLTFSNGFKAIFLKSSTLMHVTRYQQKRNSWVEVKVNESELKSLNSYLQNSFAVDESGTKLFLKNKGYTSTDDFYKAIGSYSCLKTCNSWANTGFKDSGLKSCYWTPFDFGLLNKYE